MIKAIVFDCFGVLTTDIWLDFCAQLPSGTNLSEASSLNRAYDRGIISRQDFEEAIYRLTGQKPPALESLQRGEVVKNKTLLELITKLKKDFSIGLLSNISSDWITASFLTEAEQQLFDTMVLSYEVGMTKPDPRIYELTCERLRVTPEEALMIDDREEYVEGARGVGMSGILYEDFHSFVEQLNELLATDY